MVGEYRDYTSCFLQLLGQMTSSSSFLTLIYKVSKQLILMKLGVDSIDYILSKVVFQRTGFAGFVRVLHIHKIIKESEYLG